MRHFAKAALIALTFCTIAEARAESVLDEARFGVLAQSVGGIGAAREQGAGINLEAVFKSPDFLRAVGGPRPVLGASIATDNEATSQIYALLEWKVDLGRRVFAAAGGGFAVHNGETKFDPLVDSARIGDTIFLGCRVLFRLSGDVGYRVSERLAVSVHLDHISNAELCSPNEGLDNLGVRFGYRF